MLEKKNSLPFYGRPDIFNHILQFLDIKSATTYASITKEYSREYKEALKRSKLTFAYELQIDEATLDFYLQGFSPTQVQQVYEDLKKSRYGSELKKILFECLENREFDKLITFIDREDLPLSATDPDPNNVFTSPQLFFIFGDIFGNTLVNKANYLLRKYRTLSEHYESHNNQVLAKGYREVAQEYQEFLDYCAERAFDLYGWTSRSSDDSHGKLTSVERAETSFNTFVAGIVTERRKNSEFKHTSFDPQQSFLKGMTKHDIAYFFIKTVLGTLCNQQRILTPDDRMIFQYLCQLQLNFDDERISLLGLAAATNQLPLVEEILKIGNYSPAKAQKMLRSTVPYLIYEVGDPVVLELAVITRRIPLIRETFSAFGDGMQILEHGEGQYGHLKDVYFLFKTAKEYRESGVADFNQITMLNFLCDLFKPILNKNPRFITILSRHATDESEEEEDKELINIFSQFELSAARYQSELKAVRPISPSPTEASITTSRPGTATWDTVTLMQNPAIASPLMRAREHKLDEGKLEDKKLKKRKEPEETSESRPGGGRGY